jgi:hypothetical protein
MDSDTDPDPGGPKTYGSATLSIPDIMLQWGALLGKAAQSYLRKLWNGACFSFDESPRGNDVIMADQLAGYWYLRLGGASAPKPPLWHAEKVHSALKLIFEHNVQKFAGGKLGESKTQHCLYKMSEMFVGDPFPASRSFRFEPSANFWEYCLQVLFIFAS